MLPVEELERLIRERKAINEAEMKRQRLYMEAFRMRVCPECGGYNVEYKCLLFSGGEKLTCRDCGASNTYYSDY